jgi:hypothetical protein
MPSSTSVSFLKIKSWVFLYYSISTLLALFLPFHIVLFFLTSISLRVYFDKKSKPLPARWILNIIGFLCFLFIFVINKKLFGAEPSSQLLLMLTGLKIFEMRDDKDVAFTASLGFAVLCLPLLYTLDLYIFILVFLGFVLQVLGLCQIYLSYHFTKILKIFAISLPVTIILFIFFPRLTPKYQNLVETSGRAYSGFSDNLSPGSISSIEELDKIVFQLTTDIDSQNFYFVGERLENSSGLTWTKSNQSPADLLEGHGEASFLMNYYGSQERFLFTPMSTFEVKLDQKSVQLRQKTNSLYELTSDTKENFSLRGKSWQSYTLKPTSQNLDVYLQPLDIKTKDVEDMISLLKRKKRHDTVKAVLEYFKNNNFQYDKNPGRIKSLEEFLTLRKKGFCEHYAAATAQILRWSNIPSRVVIGYSGGEYNPIGKFWSIKLKHAHAWVEYLDDDNNWTLIDPVSFTNLSPVQISASEIQKQKENSTFKLKNLILNVRYYVDYINFIWFQWIIDFNQIQSDLNLKALFKNLFIGCITVVMLFFVFSFLRKKFKYKNDDELLTEKFLALRESAASIDAKTDLNSAPLHFIKELESQFSKSEDINHFKELYVKVKYQEKKLTKQERKFLLNIKSFRFKKSSK